MKHSLLKLLLSKNITKIKKIGFLFIPVIFLFIGLFQSVIFHGEQFCARDSANFYYPLFEQIQNEWDAGRFPGWDPYDNLGQPLAANPTSSVYYPIKIIFFLPKWTGNFFTYDFCFKWFVLLHYIFAFMGMFWLLRLLKRSRTASIFAATAYTFSGPIFFQYCNIIFLIGATWFPWGIGAGLNLLLQRNFRSIVSLALVLTLCLLGGEPQTVYLLGFVLVFYAFISRKKSDQGEQNRTHFRNFFTTCLYLLAAALLAALLSAAQLIPGREMARQCERFSDRTPHSVWGLIDWKNESKMTSFSTKEQQQTSRSDSNFKNMSLSKKDQENVHPLDNILCRNVNGSGHQGSIYNFSLAPWRTLELIWPNIGGDYTKRSDRWFSLLPHDEELWTPTIYSGIITLFLGILGFHLFRGRRFRKQYRRIYAIHHSNRSSVRRSMSSNRKSVSLSDRTPNQVSVHRCESKENNLWRSCEKDLRFWACWLFWIFLAASFGGFGLVWLVRLIAVFVGQDQSISLQTGDPLGGVYWLMNLLLPGFSLFRYPAKLMTFAVFFLAFSAGLTFDPFCARFSRYRRLSTQKNKNGLCSERISDSGISYKDLDVRKQKNNSQKKNAHVNRKEVLTKKSDDIFSIRKKSVSKSKATFWIFGIFSILGSLLTFYFFRMLNTCGSGFLQSLIVLGLFLLIPSKVKRKEFISFFILLLLAGDLYWANVRYVHSMPERNYHQTPLIVDSIERDLAGAGTSLVQSSLSCSPLSKSVKTRIYRMVDWNPGSLISDTQRIQKGTIWDQKTLAPKYGYPRGVACANAQGTMINADYAKIVEKLETKFHENPQNPELPKLLRTLGIEYMILPYRNFKDKPVQILESHLLDKKMPRMFSFVSQTKDFLLEIDQEWPANTLLWKLDSPQPRIHLQRDIRKDEKLQMTSYRPNCLEFDVELTDSASVEISEQFWSGWKAQAQDDAGKIFDIPIEREKEILRRIALPAGKFHVIMSYEPSEIRTGLAISFFTLLMLAITSFVSWGLQRRRQKNRML